jgi:hypothetical protein
VLGPVQEGDSVVSMLLTMILLPWLMAVSLVLALCRAASSSDARGAADREHGER